MSTAPPALRALLLAALLGGCGGLAPLGDPAAAARQGAIELAVKSGHGAILSDIESGGGPALSRAFDAAAVPEGDRAARTLQLGGDLGLYAANPGALALALSLWGDAGRT